MSCIIFGVIFAGADDPVAVPCFVWLGGVFLSSRGVCGVFLYSVLRCIVLSVKGTALYRRVNLHLHVVEGREEMACVVQINLHNRKKKGLLVLILLQDESVDTILGKPSWAFFICETSDRKLLIPASARCTAKVL